MRKQVNEIVKIVAESLPEKIKVLEIGSLIVPGQEHLSVRKYFPDAEYIGVDIQKGNGVDMVWDCINYCYNHEKEFDLVLCLDMLEHTKYPYNVVDRAKCSLKENGTLLITSVFNFPIHEYPNDYWRFTPDCFKMLLGNNSRVYKIGSELMPHTVVGMLCTESKALPLSRDIYLYCENEIKKELKHKALTDWFPPKFIKLYMKIKYLFKRK
jgi:SAM-dependent methyltransferase